jgi:hypothetical protein
MRALSVVIHTWGIYRTCCASKIFELDFSLWRTLFVWFVILLYPIPDHKTAEDLAAAEGNLKSLHGLTGLALEQS